MCEICSKLTTNSPERHHWRRSGVSLLLTLNRFYTLSRCFHLTLKKKIAAEEKCIYGWLWTYFKHCCIIFDFEYAFFPCGEWMGVTLKCIHWPSRYLLKVNNGNTRTTSATALLSLLLSLNRFYTLICCFHCWLWTSKCWLGSIVWFFGVIFYFAVFLFLMKETKIKM